MAESEQRKRQVAYKIKNKDIINSRYVKEDGWLPNYLAIGDKKVSRVNLIGIIVSKEVDEDKNPISFMIDDGTTGVTLKFFENAAEISVGDVVTVIGRPREFGSERYVVPEIIKKIDDNRWIELRKLELASQQFNESGDEETVKDILEVETEDLAEEKNPAEKLMSIIRDIDQGPGADYDEITVKFQGSAEEHIKKLLEQGDIFEVKPGKYKLLE